jgi:hypothetical protein
MDNGAGPTALSTPSSHGKWDPSVDNFNIKISSSKEKDGKATSHHHPAGTAHKVALPANTTYQHHSTNQPGNNLPLLSPHSVTANQGAVNVPSRGSSILPSTAPNNWHQHPRQPHATADSYFPNSAGGNPSNINHLIHSAPKQPRTPGSSRAHSRQTSTASGPNTAPFPSREKAGKPAPNNMSLSLSTGAGLGEAGGRQDHGDFSNFPGPHHAGPPSPSTLTDIILGLHSTLYGAKRTPEEVRERVNAFYDKDASESSRRHLYVWSSD